ncbi:MAG: molybdopterin-dependent oxidoreductase [Chloroflexi bacterium]|nr:molybdopterin-dependent oxidoreductase [Chloroflexota bacterium]
MRDANDVWIPSVCSQCYSCCGILAHRVDGKVVKIEGNPESGNCQGRLCAKGVSGIMTLYDPSRVNVPLKRSNPEKGIDVDPGWVEISWEEALQTVAERLSKIRSEDPRKLLVMASVMTMDQMYFARLFGSAFGTPNSVWNSGAGNHCGNAEHLFGALLHSAWSKQPDTDYCSYLLNFGVPCGFGAYYAATGMAQRIADARARGMRHVVIDPFLSPTAEKADEWVPIRPGTDGALALAMLHVLLHELGAYDREYLKHHTNGPYLIGEDGCYVRERDSGKPLIWDAVDGVAKPFDAADIKDFALDGRYEMDGAAARPAFAALKEHVASFTPEWASPITTVPVATIRRITAEFAEAARIGSTIVIDGKELPYRPVAVLYFRGAQGHKNATLSSMAIELLVEMMGASNVPGGVLGQNSRCLGHPKTGRPSWSPVAGPDGLLVVGGNWSGALPYPWAQPKKPESMSLGGLAPTVIVSPASLPLVTLDPEKFKIPYKLEMNLHVGTNYLMTESDPKVSVAAFKDLFQVSSSLFLDEATYLSDLVLPDTCYLERHSLTAESVSSNSPLEEWCYHVRQPVVEPLFQRRNFSEVMLDIADRVGMREDFNAFLNLLLDLKAPYALDVSRKYTLQEILDRRFKSMFGEEHGLEWFQEHGVLKWPKRVEEVYWKPFVEVRVPIYFEWFLKVGEGVKKVAQEGGFDDVIETSAFQALPEWRPCASHQEKRSEYDLYAIYYRVPVHSFSATYNNPWLDEISQIDPYVYRVAINIETARRKGIKDGDWMDITSAGTDHTIKARARLTEGIHPEVIAMANCGGHWSKFLPIASKSDKGACFEWLLPLTFDNMDIPTFNLDLCAKVKVSKAEG